MNNSVSITASLRSRDDRQHDLNFAQSWVGADDQLKASAVHHPPGIERAQLAWDCLTQLTQAFQTQSWQATPNEAAIARIFLPQLALALALDDCTIALYNGAGTLVLARYAYQAATQTIKQLDFPSEPPIGAATAAVGITQFAVVKPQGDSAQATTQLIAPLVDFQGVLGELCGQRSQPFEPAELLLVEQLVGQWVLGLRRNRLAQSHHSQAVELKHLSQLQDAFLGTMSYELRIPLSNMQMAIQMLTLTLQRSTPTTISSAVPSDTSPNATPEKLLQYLDVLKRECDRETKLIQDLLDLQQVDADLLSLVMSAIDLEEWLPYLLKGFVNRAKDSGLSLDWQIPATLPTLMSDQITLSRIMTELVGNALRFTPAGGAIIVALQAQLRAADGSKDRAEQGIGADRGIVADQLLISVTNTGVEIPIAEQAKVFDKFYRVTSLDVRRTGGIGLGLPLAQQLARQLGGDIQLESSAGRTCFTVMLPL